MILDGITMWVGPDFSTTEPKVFVISASSSAGWIYSIFDPPPNNPSPLSAPPTSCCSTPTPLQPSTPPPLHPPTPLLALLLRFIAPGSQTAEKPPRAERSVISTLSSKHSACSHCATRARANCYFYGT